jgi:hypothetical protein
MLADNVALELLLRQHDQLAKTEHICGKWVHMGVRAALDKKDIIGITIMRIIIINGVTRVVKWRPACQWVCVHTVMRPRECG